ncbi:hypothetical protein N2152v2_008125 [Parachlorella kessleri]
MPVLPGCALVVLVDPSCFRFEPPLGEPLAWERFSEKKQGALRHLLNHTFPLSVALQQRIQQHVKYQETSSGFWKLLCFGICLPSGMLLKGTFDYDRDLPTLTREVQAVVAGILQPTDYELAEHISAEELFSKGGKPLLRCYLTP